MFRLIEKTSYIFLTLWVIIYVFSIIGVTLNFLPPSTFIWTSILLFIGLFLLFVKALKERIKNKEDSHYSKNIKR